MRGRERMKHAGNKPGAVIHHSRHLAHKTRKVINVMKRSCREDEIELRITEWKRLANVGNSEVNVETALGGLLPGKRDHRLRKIQRGYVRTSLCKSARVWSGATTQFQDLQAGDVADNLLNRRPLDVVRV